MFSISLGNDMIGEGDNMGVVVPWCPPDAFEGVTADHLRKVQAAVSAGEWKESSQAKDWVGFAVATAMGLSAEKEAKADRARIGTLLRTWISTGALVVVEKRDPKKREDKKFVEVGEWAVDGVAPPAKGGAGQGGASRAPTVPRPTCPPLGQGGGAGGAGIEKQVGQNTSGAASRVARFPAGNPALRPLVDADEEDPAADFYDTDKRPRF